MANKEKRRKIDLRPKSIKTRIAGAIIIVAVALVLTTGITAVVLSDRIATRTAESSMEETAVIAANSVANDIDRLKMLTQEIVAGYCGTEKYKYISERASLEGALASGLINMDGIATSGEDFSGEWFFQSAAAGRSTVSSVYINAAGDGAVFYVAAPVITDGKTSAVLYLCYDYMKLSDMVANFNPAGAGEAYILDSTGATMAYPADPETVLAAENFTADAAKGIMPEEYSYDIVDIEGSMTRGETGVSQYIWHKDGGNVVYIQSYAPIQGTDGWSLAISVEQRVMVRGTDQMALMLAVVAVVVTILAVIFGVFEARQISRPVVACAERIKLLAMGDIHTPAPEIKERDEIRLLADDTAKLIKDYSEMTRDLESVCDTLSDKDLTLKTNAEYPGDFAPLKTALNHIIDVLSDVMRRIDTVSEQVDVGSEQIAASANMLAESATAQSAMVQELTSTMQDISTQASGNAAGASETSEQTRNAAMSAGMASEMMERMVEAMHEITARSTQIGAIIKTIENIAFQTNILALNASVEAARAGEAGKGFTVVAEEVRNLAQRSSEAAQSTTVLIDQTLEAVRKGDDIAQKTAESVHSVIEMTSKIETLAQQIADASKQQLDVVENAASSVRTISDAVLSSSAGSEESAATSRELSEQAHLLKSLVSEFKLD